MLINNMVDFLNPLLKPAINYQKKIKRNKIVGI